MTLDQDTYVRLRRELSLSMVQLAAATDGLRRLSADANPAKVIAAAQRVSAHHDKALTTLLTLADQPDADTRARQAYGHLLGQAIGPVVRGEESVTDAVDRLAVPR